MQIQIIPTRDDNYSYLFSGTTKDSYYLVDCGEAYPVVDELKRLGIERVSLLVTHGHCDHVDGIEGLSKEVVVCERIGWVEPSPSFLIGGYRCDIRKAQGHARDHLLFYFPDEKVLFSGDVLFAAGCGRLFSGTADEAYPSFEWIRSLPEDTKIYCGHEYTLGCLKFAAFMEPDNKAIQQRVIKVKALREQGRPTLPTTLAEELLTNPFLRWDAPELLATLKEKLGRVIEPGLEGFRETRALKDLF